jgi:hypothetical protein
MPTSGNQRPKLLRLAIFCALVAVGGLALALWFPRSHVDVSPPEPPRGDIAPISLPPTASHLSLAVSFPTSEIAPILEKELPKTFKFDVDKKGVRAYGSPSRGPVSVKTDVGARRVVASAPVLGKVQVEKTIVLKVSAGIDVSSDITASFSPVATKDWTIQPHLNLSAHVNRATVKTPVTDIDVTSHVQGAVDSAIGRIKRPAEIALASQLAFRDDASSVWDKIHSVHRLVDDPPVWLRITPYEVTFENFSYTNDSIKAGLALGLEMHVFIQKDAPELKKANAIPLLNTVSAVSDDFSLSIPVQVSYATINEQLKARLCSSAFELPDNPRLMITGVTVEPYGEGVLLTVDFHGKNGLLRSASGRLYIVGVPVFDAAKSELRLDKLEYTAATKSRLVEGVEWLAHSKLLDSIAAASVVNLRDEMEKAKTSANQHLVRITERLPKEIGANASVSEIRIERLAFAKESAFALVNVKGKMSARLR